MDTLFLDTGYLIALEAIDDQHHQAASLHWQEIAQTLPPIITTTYIFDEVVTFFSSRKRHQKAVEIGLNLLKSEFIELIQVSERLFLDSFDYFQKHQDKTFSLTDCISFSLMNERGISTALTFDKHFSQAGFQILPDKLSTKL